MSRQPLSEISGNSNYRDDIEGRFELTPHWHSHIVGCVVAGQSSKNITADLNISSVTIQSTIFQADSCYENESLHQSDSLNIINEHLCCCLLCEIYVNFKIQYRDL